MVAVLIDVDETERQTFLTVSVVLCEHTYLCDICISYLVTAVFMGSVHGWTFS